MVAPSQTIFTFSSPESDATITFINSTTVNGVVSQHGKAFDIVASADALEVRKIAPSLSCNRHLVSSLSCPRVDTSPRHLVSSPHHITSPSRVLISSQPLPRHLVPSPYHSHYLPRHFVSSSNHISSPFRVLISSHHHAISCPHPITSSRHLVSSSHHITSPSRVLI